MSDNPVAEGPADPAPRRNPLSWLLVTVLFGLGAVLVVAVVMVVRMLA